jgi:hypothetical protein
MEAIVQQRNHLASVLIEADATILELLDRTAELQGALPSPEIIPLGQKKNLNVSAQFMQLNLSRRPRYSIPEHTILPFIYKNPRV